MTKRPAWERRYATALLLIDVLLVCSAAALAYRIRYPAGTVPTLGGLPTPMVIAGLGPAWVLVLAMSHAYESRLLGDGSEEYKRVLAGTWRFAAILAVTSYAFKAELTRGFYVICLPLGTALLLAARAAARRVLAGRRRDGKAARRLLIVGPDTLAREIAAQVGSLTNAAFTVVGVCCPTDPSEALSDIASQRADTVAVVGASDLPRGFVRRLAWNLEGSAVDLMVAPDITDVAGPRIHVRPVAGLSLLYLEAPTFSGLTRVVKTAFDLVLASLLAVLSAPLVLAICVLIRMGSPGPSLFRQTRLGRGGKEFKVWKFRTMHAGAQHREESLTNEAGGQLFKVRRDPRVTGMGRRLRRFSLDELPQLWNVLAGQMSLVGPRPLPASLDDFAHEERRRMLVKPGMTGLWQVSGRSDLDWEETIRLDLYYVENWSLALDVVILLRTAVAVARGRGAY